MNIVPQSKDYRSKVTTKVEVCEHIWNWEEGQKIGNSFNTSYHVLAVGRRSFTYGTILMENFCGPPPPLSLLNPPNGNLELVTNTSYCWYTTAGI